jgi:putative spermidine/putrescine transport system permease protein
MDPALEEAAMDLGATATQTLLRVTFPLVRVGIATATVFAFMFSFDEVEASFFISPVSGRTLPIEMFIFMEQDQSPTIAALSSLLILGTLLVVMACGLFAGWRRMLRVWVRE